MNKYFLLLVFCVASVFALPSFAHADAMNDGYNLNYDVSFRGFYWGANVTTNNYNANGNGYGAELDVRFGRGSGMENWGFGAEYTYTSNAPLFYNTGGAFATATATGQPGFPVGTGGGGFGLVAPGNMQFGGGKVKYFFPMSSSSFTPGIYVDWLGMTGGRSTIGAGLEADWDVTNSISWDSWIDWGNVTGGTFPSQLLTRYETLVSYRIPDTKVNVFAGYRMYSFSRFYKTSIGGYILGAGTRW